MMGAEHEVEPAGRMRRPDEFAAAILDGVDARGDGIRSRPPRPRDRPDGWRHRPSIRTATRSRAMPLIRAPSTSRTARPPSRATTCPFSLLRKPMKSATSRCAGRLIKLLRRADLPDDAVAQDDDPVGERQGLVLVVRHVDGGRAELVVDAPDLGAHLEAQLRVEIRERLVHQHERRLDDDGAGDRHALLLAAGELARQLVLLSAAGARGSGPRRPCGRSRPWACPRIFRPKPMFWRTLRCGKSA